MRALYTALITLLLPLIVIRLLIKSRKLPAYRKRIGERFAINALPQLQECIWVHAVSVGETMAATPLIKALQEKYPNNPILVTTTTPTGSAQLTDTFGNEVYHTYLPYDVPLLIKAFIKKINPKCLLIMETELWPNTIYAAANQCPVALINARLSEKSFKGYSRFNNTTQNVLNQLSVIAASDEASAERFKLLGYANTLSTTGNIKFDGINIESSSSNTTEPDSRLTFTAGSTHEGEEQVLLAIYNKLQKSEQGHRLRLVLAPRHPERFNSTESLIQSFGFKYKKSSTLAGNEDIPADTQVILLNEMGKLVKWYGKSDIAIVGGSLVPIGGHNVIEAMAYQIPVITGKYVENFKSIISDLTHANGIAIVKSEDDLYDLLTSFLNTPEAFDTQVRNATAYLRDSQGALTNIMTLLDLQILNAAQ